MNLSSQQRAAIKADIISKSAPGGPLEALLAGGDYDGIAAWYMQTASPAWWVWRTNVTRAEIYHRTSHTGSTWNWTTYKNQSQGEQGAWVQMFMGDQADFSLANLRSGVDAIFSGTGAQATQRGHILAIGRRQARRLEQLLAVPEQNSGTTAIPATMTYDQTRDGDLDGATVFVIMRE